MQYMAWPDHGVPDDSTDFLDFVSLVRTKREDSQDPVVVHCRSGLENNRPCTSAVTPTSRESIRFRPRPSPHIPTNCSCFKCLDHH